MCTPKRAPVTERSEYAKKKESKKDAQLCVWAAFGCVLVCRNMCPSAHGFTCRQRWDHLYKPKTFQGCPSVIPADESQRKGSLV